MATEENTKRVGAANRATQNHEGVTSRTAGAAVAASSPKGPDRTLGGGTASALAASTGLRREQPVATKKLTYEERMRALAPIVQVRRRVDSTIKRFGNLADDVRRWKNAPSLREAAAKVELALAGMLAEAMTTADTFVPEKQRKPTANELKPGTKLALRDKFFARYEGILDAAERVDLEVVTTARRHVAVKTATGARIVLPRGHLAKSAACSAVSASVDASTYSA